MQATLKLIDWREVATVVVTGLITFAVLAYYAGEALGRSIHTANNRLASVHVAALNVRQPLPVGAPPMAASRTGEHVRTTFGWLAVDAGTEAVLSEHATEVQAAAACQAYRLSHPGRCPRVQEDWRYVFVPAAAMA